MKTDCFAYGHDCQVLTEKNCNGCAFYKTKKQHEDGRKSTIQALDVKGIVGLKKDTYPLFNNICKGVGI